MSRIVCVAVIVACSMMDLSFDCDAMEDRYTDSYLCFGRVLDIFEVELTLGFGTKESNY